MESVYESSRCAERIGEVFPQYAGYYLGNANAYNEKLVELDKDFFAVIEKNTQDTIFVADRFPFLYLFHRLGLKHMAAIPNCTTDTDVSAADRVRFENFISTNELTKAVVTERPVTGNLARELVGADNVVTLHSMQRVTAGEIQSGATFYSLMRQNLERLEVALS